MIARVSGKVVEVRPMRVVIDVGGVGYAVSVTARSGFKVSESVTLHTYLAVRENAMDLYGFSDERELMMFEELIKIPKIGPKTALGVLSQADLETLTKAVETDDPSYLTKLSGIGKKSAEKIVAGLKDVLGDRVLPTAAGVSSGHDGDVIDALIALGYSERDARQAVQKIPKDITDTNARLKHALK